MSAAEDYERVNPAGLPPSYLGALVEISRAADRFKADEITSLRFVVIAGLVLSGLYAAREREATSATGETAA